MMMLTTFSVEKHRCWHTVGKGKREVRKRLKSPPARKFISNSPHSPIYTCRRSSLSYILLQVLCSSYSRLSCPPFHRESIAHRQHSISFVLAAKNDSAVTAANNSIAIFPNYYVVECMLDLSSAVPNIQLHSIDSIFLPQQQQQLWALEPLPYPILFFSFLHKYIKYIIEGELMKRK